MASPKFEGSFNLGNLIELGGLIFQAVIVLVGLVGFWTALNDRIGNLETKMGGIEILANQMASSSTTLAVDDRRLTALETAVANQGTSNSKIIDTLSAIQADVAVLKARGN